MCSRHIARFRKSSYNDKIRIFYSKRQACLPRIICICFIYYNHSVRIPLYQFFNIGYRYSKACRIIWICKNYISIQIHIVVYIYRKIILYRYFFHIKTICFCVCAVKSIRYIRKIYLHSPSEKTHKYKAEYFIRTVSDKNFILCNTIYFCNSTSEIVAMRICIVAHIPYFTFRYGLKYLR